MTNAEIKGHFMASPRIAAGLLHPTYSNYPEAKLLQDIWDAKWRKSRSRKRQESASGGKVQK